MVPMIVPDKTYSVMHDALELVCQEYKPVTYLEIGVQEGLSLQVAVRATKSISFITMIDTWGTEHGGTGRGSHVHIDALLSNEKYHGYVRYLDGSSHEILPTMGGELYDLILVDGDHSRSGAIADLAQSWPLLKTDGILVFDDIACPPYPHLIHVWKEFIHKNTDIVELVCQIDRPFGVAVARKT
jgi:hypothetical protein